MSARRRGSWGLADQVVSSLTNALLSVLVARSVDASAFGAFGIAFAIYSFAVGVSRALCSQPLAIRHASAAAPSLRLEVARSTGTAVVVGLVVGAGVAIAGLLLGDAIGSVLVVLGITMPGLLLQDAWRYVFFTAGRPQRALVNDLLWGLLQIITVVALVEFGDPGVSSLLAAWGLSAALAALVGGLQARVLPRPSATRGWLGEHRRLVGPLAGEYAVNMGAFNTTMLIIAGLGQVVVVGALRGAQVLLGPLRVLVLAAQSSGLPEIARRAATDRGRVRRDCAAVSLALTALTTFTTVVLVLMPERVGLALLGDSWEGATRVIPWVGVMLVATSLTSGATLGLHALQLARWTFRASLWQAPVTLALPVAAAMTTGSLSVIAAAVGMSHWVAAVYLWRRLWLETR